MGIYIKKVLGYGVQMTTEEASNLLDGKVSRGLRAKTGESYAEFLRVKYADTDPEDMNYYLNDLQSSIAGSLPEFTASDFITIADNGMDGGPEGDTAWVVLTPPLVCKEWKHNDDPIDFYEESYKHQDAGWKFEQNMKFINQGLFPYEGTYINHVTGEVLDSSLHSTVRRYIELTKDESTPAEDQALRLLLASVKVSSIEEFKEVVHPAPPVSVIDIAEWTGIFKDISIAPRLRPCLLQYWS